MLLNWKNRSNDNEIIWLLGPKPRFKSPNPKLPVRGCSQVLMGEDLDSLLISCSFQSLSNLEVNIFFLPGNFYVCRRNVESIVCL